MAWPLCASRSPRRCVHLPSACERMRVCTLLPTNPTGCTGASAMRQPETGAIFKSLIAADKNAQARPPSAVAVGRPRSVAVGRRRSVARAPQCNSVPSRAGRAAASYYDIHPSIRAHARDARHRPTRAWWQRTPARRGGPSSADRCPRDAHEIATPVRSVAEALRRLDVPPHRPRQTLRGRLRRQGDPRPPHSRACARARTCTPARAGADWSTARAITRRASRSPRLSVAQCSGLSAAPA
jgi:hypothetical protein